jgi:error-prone DNA polymerase
VVARVRELTAKRPAKHDPENQLDFDIDDRYLVPRGNADLTPAQRANVELRVLDMDATQHLIEAYRPMLDEYGITPASNLRDLWNRSEVLVAGIRIATQTPPMRTGKRVVFISLDDGTGCADATFFEEAQERTGSLLFGTKMLLIKGRTRRTGEKGISIEAEQAWDLRALWREWKTKQKAAGGETPARAESTAGASTVEV